MREYKITIRTLDGVNVEMPTINAETAADALETARDVYRDGAICKAEDRATWISPSVIGGIMVTELMEPSRIEYIH